MRRSAVRAARAATRGAVALTLVPTPSDAAAATLTPTNGPVGSSVTITGTGFTGATHVQFARSGGGTVDTTYSVPDDQHSSATHRGTGSAPPGEVTGAA